MANNLFVYAYKTLGIIYSCVRDYRPSMVFNAMTLALLALATGLGGFFVWHRLATGSFSPHIWAGFTSAFLWGLGFLTFLMSQVAFMLSRLRLLHEEQLYLARKQAGALAALGIDLGEAVQRTSAIVTVGTIVIFEERPAYVISEIRVGDQVYAWRDPETILLDKHG